MLPVASCADWGDEVPLSADLLQIYNQQGKITVHPQTSYQPPSERTLRTSNYKLIYEQTQLTTYSISKLMVCVEQIIGSWATHKQLADNEAMSFYRA